MDIEVSFTDQPIRHAEKKFSPHDGAVAEFWGVVRGQEDGAPIGGLRYEIYEPMAREVIKRLLEDLNTPHPCTSALVIHRSGIVPAGEASIYVRIASKHRAEAFRVLEQFMTRMKREAPIWKTEALPC